MAHRHGIEQLDNLLDESGNGIKYAHVNGEKRTISSGTDACDFSNSRPAGGWADSPTDESGNYTLYAAAANVNSGTIYPNIYIVSSNDNASDEAQEIFDQLLENWRFNANTDEVTDINLCSVDGDYVTDEEGNIVATVTTDSEVSLEDSLRDSSGQLVTDSENYISRVGLEISRDPPRGIAELLPGTTLMEAVCTPNGPIYHITQCNTGQVCRNGACMENN